MGGASNWIYAPTMEELEKKAKGWHSWARSMDMAMRLGWEKDRVEECEGGYRIFMSVGK